MLHRKWLQLSNSLMPAFGLPWRCGICFLVPWLKGIIFWGVLNSVLNPPCMQALWFSMIGLSLWFPHDQHVCWCHCWCMILKMNVVPPQSCASLYIQNSGVELSSVCTIPQIIFNWTHLWNRPWVEDLKSFCCFTGKEAFWYENTHKLIFGHIWHVQNWQMIN